MCHPRFKGNHYDIGLKFGKILRKKNIDFDKIIRLDDFQKFQNDFNQTYQDAFSWKFDYYISNLWHFINKPSLGEENTKASLREN
jgi:predicted choloylglycine hydrolase